MGSVVLEPPRLDALSCLWWRAFETAHSALRAAGAYLDGRELVERSGRLDEERSNVARLLRDLARDLRGKSVDPADAHLAATLDFAAPCQEFEANPLVIVEEQWRLVRAAIQTYRRDDEPKAA